MAALRKELRLSKSAAARALAAIIGNPISRNRFVDWEKADELDGYSLAAVAMLHPNPLACIAWLRKGGKMPSIHVDRADPEMRRQFLAELREMFREALGDQPDRRVSGG